MERERKRKKEKGRERKTIENVDVEFKELDRQNGALPDSTAKEIIAFANTEGGVLYIGIRNDGSVTGVDDPDDVMTRLSNTLHDTVLPDVMPFVQIRCVEMESKYVIQATVSVGTERPYYLAREGLKPKGVYMRRGSSCVPVNEAGIRALIMETSGKSFEESRSLDQELTFDTLKEAMASRSLEFGQAQMKTLRLIGSDGLYTNLALLLSDQCPYTIKAAVFQGTENEVFRDRREFTGSLLKQLDSAYRYLDFYNQTEALFNGLLREDRRDYPADALREALLNSIIHRDYLFSGSNIINLNADHVEFISLGGLVMGLSMEAIFMGASQSRNPNLAAVFYRLKLVESYGTGIRRIMRLYKDQIRRPEFKTAEGVFSVFLPNTNYLPTEKTQPEQKTVQDETTLIVDLVRQKGVVTRKDVENALRSGSTKAYRLIKQLCEQGILRQRSQGRLTTYSLNE